MKILPLSDLRRRHSRRGSSLLLVFWLVAMMGMLIYSATVVVSQDLEMTKSQKQAFRARQLAEMGLNIAMNPVVKESDFGLLNQGPGVENTVMLPLLMQLEEGEMVSVKIKGEGGRININALLQSGEKGRQGFHYLLSAWGVPDDKGSDLGHDAIFDHLVDWTDADSTSAGLHGMEKDEYQALFGETTPYPFNRPFYDLDELLLVPGFEQVSAVVGDFRDYFTIYSAGVGIDPDQAEAKVLAAVVMMLKSSEPDAADFEKAKEDAQEILSMKFGADGLEDTEDDVKIDQATALSSLGLQADDGPAGGFTASELIGSTDQTVHIQSDATVGEYRKRVVLIVRNRTGTPQILTRKEIPLFENK